jgi:hypothetical protein
VLDPPPSLDEHGVEELVLAAEVGVDQLLVGVSRSGDAVDPGPGEGRALLTLRDLGGER